MISFCSSNDFFNRVSLGERIEQSPKKRVKFSTNFQILKLTSEGHNFRSNDCKQIYCSSKLLVQKNLNGIIPPWQTST